MRAKLLLMLAVAVVIGGGVAHEAFAGRDSAAGATKQTLSASQMAARKKLAAQAAFLKRNGLSCGCRHHFPAAKSGG